MLLEGKSAVVYGGGGSIGGAIARAFASEGARVHLAGRTRSALDRVAGEVRAAGGAVDAAELDALDEGAVEEHARAVVAAAGGIDVSVNVVSYGDVHGTPLAEMPLEDFERPIRNAVRTQFLTTRAAARQMIRQRSGVILFFGGDGGRDPIRDYYIGGFMVALGAIEVLRRQLAAELGSHGIRVLTLHSGGVPETIPEGYPRRDAITEQIVGETMLGRAAGLEDVGRVAAFAASDAAGSMTATALNITCGSVAD
jgi:3-oxoacyl-[acyl-carrier protein] reductase